MELSTTDSENVYVPANVGVPAKAPLKEPGAGCWIRSPSGNAVVVKENKSGRVPPPVLIGALYGTPTIPLGNSPMKGPTLLEARVGEDLAFVTGQNGYYDSDYGSWIKHPRTAASCPEGPLTQISTASG